MPSSPNVAQITRSGKTTWSKNSCDGYAESRWRRVHRCSEASWSGLRSHSRREENFEMAALERPAPETGSGVFTNHGGIGASDIDRYRSWYSFAQRALTAIEVIASINRQGLVHPKEPGLALVALETSRNPVIAEVAFQKQYLLH